MDISVEGVLFDRVTQIITVTIQVQYNDLNALWIQRKRETQCWIVVWPLPMFLSECMQFGRNISAYVNHSSSTLSDRHVV